MPPRAAKSPRPDDIFDCFSRRDSLFYPGLVSNRVYIVKKIVNGKASVLGRQPILCRLIFARMLFIYNGRLTINREKNRLLVC